MHRPTRIALVAACFALLRPDAACAQSSFERLELALRVGYGAPAGLSHDRTRMLDEYSWEIPVWLDIGYRLTPHIVVGAYGQYGRVWLSDALCPADASCWGRHLRGGLGGYAHFNPEGTVDPWAGVSLGYEALTRVIETRSQRFEKTSLGWEYINMHVGMDVDVGAVAVGPYASFSVGSFNRVAIDHATVPIDDQAIHMWINAGVRVAYRFW